MQRLSSIPPKHGQGVESPVEVHASPHRGKTGIVVGNVHLVSKGDCHLFPGIEGGIKNEGYECFPRFSETDRTSISSLYCNDVEGTGMGPSALDLPREICCEETLIEHFGIEEELLLPHGCRRPVRYHHVEDGPYRVFPGRDFKVKGLGPNTGGGTFRQKKDSHGTDNERSGYRQRYFAIPDLLTHQPGYPCPSYHREREGPIEPELSGRCPRVPCLPSMRPSTPGRRR